MSSSLLSSSSSSSSKSNNYALAISYVIHELIQSYDHGMTLNLTKLKQDASKKYKLQGIVKMCDILQGLPIQYRNKLYPYLQTKPVRTASGVAVVAVMCKPHRCPHIAYTNGEVCIYCPGGIDSDFEYSTQAYTGYEPTSMRAIRARYNPYTQVTGRVQQLYNIGHNVDKVEFIIMGGTFLSLDKQYKDYFIRNLHDALSGYHSTCVRDSIQYSEVSSNIKCIGITIETRPDYCLKPHIEEMLSYGCTRIEIGVQSIYESIAKETNRGHTIQQVIHCLQLSKDAGYKIVTHLMPDLPNMTYERDLLGIQEYFYNPSFRSDGIKLYPTLVIRGTGLYELWRIGKYKNYTPEQLVELTATILELIPPWTRLYRIQRDIPMPLVSSGVEHGNLRELALQKLKDKHGHGAVGADGGGAGDNYSMIQNPNQNHYCLDIRMREVGIKQIHTSLLPDQVELIRRDYVANNGWETFLSYEDPKQDILIGLLRLRKVSNDAWLKEMTCTMDTSTNGNGGMIRCSIIRELHVYGTTVSISERDPTKFQHQGFGQLLLEEAERIAKYEHYSTKLLIISGIGTRNYYRKFNYTLDGPYMSKEL